jgi:hypothetical protein
MILAGPMRGNGDLVVIPAKRAKASPVRFGVKLETGVGVIESGI